MGCCDNDAEDIASGIWYSGWSICCAAVLGAIVVPASLFYADALVIRVLWWIFWVILILSSLCLSCALWGGNDGDFKSPQKVPLCVTCSLSPMLLAGMWLLKDYSVFHLANIAHNVTPDEVGEIYKHQEIGLYKFMEGRDGGYVQRSPTNLYPELPLGKRYPFTFECHGYWVQQTCQGEVCPAVCDVTRCQTDDQGVERCECGKSHEECHGEEYDCSTWVYPDKCPGYHMLFFAPLWPDEANALGDPEGARPAAIVFQWQSFLLDLHEDEVAHFEEQAAAEFKVEMCSLSNLPQPGAVVEYLTYIVGIWRSHQGTGMCAVDVRIGAMERHWNAYLEMTPVPVSDGVGKHIKPENLNQSTSDVLNHLDKDAPLWGQKVPVLWMPQQARHVTHSITADLEYSEERGRVAIMLLSVVGVVILLPFVCILSCCCCWPVFKRAAPVALDALEAALEALEAAPDACVRACKCLKNACGFSGVVPGGSGRMKVQPIDGDNFPRYWSSPQKSLGSFGEFDEMVYVSKEQHDVFNDLLSASYRARCTQDRPCPLGTCPKTPGGCPCNRPDGNPGLPEYRVRRVVRVEDSNLWQRYLKRRDAIRDAHKKDEMKVTLKDGSKRKVLTFLKGSSPVTKTGTDVSDPSWDSVMVEGEDDPVPKKQVQRIDDTDLWHPDPGVATHAVTAWRQDIFDPLEDSINEVYLWHGTNLWAALSIAENQFSLSLAGSNAGTMYGRGIYMCEHCTKADEYGKATETASDKDVYAMLLCRTILGKYNYTTSRNEAASDEVRSGQFDSVIGDRMTKANTFREVVVCDPDQAYPEYIVLYTRTFKHESKEVIQARISRPLRLDVPLYWHHRGKNPKTTSFNDEFPITQGKDQLQNLVQASLNRDTASKARVVRIRRIENSAIWNRYVDFKRRLWTELDADLKGSCTPISQLRTQSGNLANAIMTHFAADEIGIADSLDSNLNAHMLWHGTSKSAAEAIVKDDFVISKNPKHGSRFGNGAYFAESLDKSLSYTTPENGVHFVLLCRVACGELFLTERTSHRDALDVAMSERKHCVLASPRQEAREFIIPSVDQVYAEFIFEIELSDGLTGG